MVIGLDLCAAPDAGPVGVKDIAQAAGITESAVRGQLAGLTRKLRNPKYEFDQKAWPVKVTWLASGVVSYDLDPALAAIWRNLRADTAPMPGPAPSVDDD